MPESGDNPTTKYAAGIRRLLGFSRSLPLPVGICTASGVALAFAYPGWDISELVWLAPAPILAVLWLLLRGSGRRRCVAGAICGLGAGCGFFLTNIFWVTEVSLLGWLAIGIYLALYFSIWGAVAATAGCPRFQLYRPDPDEAEATPSRAAQLFASSADSLRVALVTASAWTALEWVRGWMFTGFAWNGLGAALHENHVLIQICDVVGATGLSFFVMLAVSIGTTTTYRIILEIRHARIRPHADFFLVLAVFMGLFFYGTQRIREVGKWEQSPETQTFHCLVAQPNIPQEQKWDRLYAYDILEELRTLTKLGLASSSNPSKALDLVIWPETSIPFSLQSVGTKDFLDEILAEGEFALLTGVNDIVSDTEYYNAMALFDRDYFDRELYRKMHLVPFGEFIPFRESFPLFDWIAGSQITDDFSWGQFANPLPLPTKISPNAEIIPLICFEDTVPTLPRKFLTDNPQFMVTVTNNGWFNESSNAVQHAVNAKFRCVELRLPMLRSANNGMTCYIRPSGKVDSRLEPFEWGALLIDVDVPGGRPPTFYAQHGDLFSKVLAGMALLLIALHVRSRIRKPVEPRHR